MMAVYRPPAAYLRARFEARDPLLLAGLQRAATLAGIVEATPDLEDLALRSGGDGPRHPSLDVICDDRSVVITLTRQPSLASWLIVLDLIAHLTSA